MEIIIPQGEFILLIIKMILNIQPTYFHLTKIVFLFHSAIRVRHYLTVFVFLSISTFFKYFFILFIYLNLHAKNYCIREKNLKIKLTTNFLIGLVVILRTSGSFSLDNFYLKFY